MSDTQTPFFTPAEVAHRWGVHRRSVERLLASGALPCVRIAPRSLRIRSEDVLAFEQARSTR